MKTISKDGKTWFEKNAKGQTSIGFTNVLLNELQECWHILPASQETIIKEGQPLCSVETNDGVFAIRAPCAGIVTFFDNKAVNFPDQVVPEQVVAIMEDKIPEKKKTAKKSDMDMWLEEAIHPRGRAPGQRGLPFIPVAAPAPAVDAVLEPLLPHAMRPVRPPRWHINVAGNVEQVIMDDIEGEDL